MMRMKFCIIILSVSLLIVGYGQAIQHPAHVLKEQGGNRQLPNKMVTLLESMI